LQSMLVVRPPTSKTCQSAIAKYDVWLTTCDQFQCEIAAFKSF